MAETVLTTEVDPPKPEPQRKSGGWRRVRLASLLLLALVIVSVLIVLQTGVVGRIVLGRFESAMGCTATASNVRVTINGSVIVHDLELRAPSVQGPAAVFFQAPEVRIDPIWASLLTSTPRIDRIELFEPIVRISQDDELRLNVGGLTTRGTAPGGPTPTINIIDGVIELGEFGPGWNTPLTALRVHGKLARVAPGSTRYVVQLLEKQKPGVEPLLLDGEFDLADLSGSLRLGSLNLARFGETPAPTRVAPLWRQMALAGTLHESEFTYSKADGVTALFRLERVDLNIPLPAERPETAQGAVAMSSEELLRMRGVSGQIRIDRAGLHADLTGKIEDLGCRVTLDTEGFSLDSALTCTIRADEFHVAEQPRLLPFAPPIVRRNFERFSGPTALVSGEVEIRRAVPAGALAVNGLITFSNGAARFEKFPYPFGQMSGSVRFDETKVTLERITGVGPTGAQLSATGLIAPPADGAGVDVYIVVTDVPADEVLYEAIPEHRRMMFDALFSRDELAKLHKAGIVQSPETHRIAVARRIELEQSIGQLRFEAHSEDAIEAARSEIADLDDQLKVPLFELAGQSEIRVHVHRDEGPNVEYETEIVVSLVQAGLVPEAYPYPVVAQNFSLRIDDNRAIAEAPMLLGVSGISGSMRVLVEFQPDGPDDFDIFVKATGVPVDRALLSALERRDRSRESNDGAVARLEGGEVDWSPARLLRDLGVSGRGSCDAHVVSRERGAVTYQIDVHFDDVKAQPGGSDLELTAISGDLKITEDAVHITDLEGLVGDGRFAADLAATGLSGQGAGHPPRLEGKFELADLELSQRIERLIVAFSPQHADAMTDLRDAHDPGGRVNALITMDSENGELEYRVELANPRAVSFVALGGRFEIRNSSGLFSVGYDAVVCEGFVASLAYEDEPAGLLTLDGRWPVTTSVPGDGELLIGLRDGQFASPIVKAFLATLDENAASWLTASELSGSFDANGVAHTTLSGQTFFSGALIPKTISVARNGVRSDFDEVDGRITFGSEGGHIESLTAKGRDWSFVVDGSWTSQPSQTLDVAFTIDASKLEDSMIALAPSAVSQSRDAINLRVDGPIVVRDGSLRLDLQPPEGQPMLRLAFNTTFHNVSLDPGVAIRLDQGAAATTIEMPDLNGAPVLDMSITASSLVAAEMGLNDGTMRLRSGRTPDVFLFEHGRARAHGGELAFEGSVRATSVDASSGYELNLRAAGMDFASLLAEARRSTEMGVTRSGDVEPVAKADAAADVVRGSKGSLDAYIGLAGPIGETASRRGVGIVQIKGGEVVELPGLTGLLRLSNLQAPVGAVLDHALVLFHIRGDRVAFETIEVGSDSFMIVGEGNMNLPDMSLDLRFNTRGSAGIPILSDIFRGLRDEIVTTEMTGTLRNPESRLIQLPATRRMLGSIFRGESRSRPPEATRTSPASAEATSSGSSDE